MPHTLDVAFASPFQRLKRIAIVIAVGAMALSGNVESQGVSLRDGLHARAADRPESEDERKLLADLGRVQRRATEDLNPERFDRDMVAAFLARGLDLDHVEAKAVAAKLSTWRSKSEVVAAIDDWSNVRRRELGVESWRQLANVARAADADPWRNVVRAQFDRPPAESITSLRACAADVAALKTQPARSLILLVRMLWDAGDPATSIPVLNIAVRRFPNDFWVCIEQGNLNMVAAPSPDPAEAARYFAQAIALCPNSHAAHESLANALADQKKYDEAIGEFRMAIKLNPQDPDTYQNLGEALLLQGKTAEAIGTLELAIKFRPEFPDAYFALGVALASQGHKDKAITAFREAIRLNPDLLDAQANVPINHGRDEALAAFRAAIQTAPRPVGIRPNAMVKIANDMQPKEILEIERKDVRLDPRVVGHIDRGRSLIAQNEFDKAIAELSAAIRLEPACADAYIHRAFALSSKREYTRAISDYDKAVMLEPQHAAAYNDRAWLRATCPVAEHRDANKALQSAIWACALSSWKNPHSLGTLAASYAEAGDFASAVKWQATAISLLGVEREKQDFGHRLELYRRETPYRQEPRK